MRREEEGTRKAGGGSICLPLHTQSRRASKLKRGEDYIHVIKYVPLLLLLLHPIFDTRCLRHDDSFFAQDPHTVLNLPSVSKCDLGLGPENMYVVVRLSSPFVSSLSLPTQSRGGQASSRKEKTT